MCHLLSSGVLFDYIIFYCGKLVENFFNKSVDNDDNVVYNRGIKKGNNMEDKKPENKNLSESQKRVQEIAKECGLKRII